MAKTGKIEGKVLKDTERDGKLSSVIEDATQKMNNKPENENQALNRIPNRELSSKTKAKFRYID